MSIAQRFSKRLRSLIKERRTSAERLAYEAGISKSYLSAVLRCRKSPTLRTIEKIAKTLDLDIRDLF